MNSGFLLTEPTKQPKRIEFCIQSPGLQRNSSTTDGNRNQEHYLSSEGTYFTECVAALLPQVENADISPILENRELALRMQAYWDAAQEAKSRDLSLRAIAREQDISRGTVAKYAKASNPPAHAEGLPEENRERNLTESFVSSP